MLSCKKFWSVSWRALLSSKDCSFSIDRLACKLWGRPRRLEKNSKLNCLFHEVNRTNKLLCEASDVVLRSYPVGITAAVFWHFKVLTWRWFPPVETCPKPQRPWVITATSFKLLIIIPLSLFTLETLSHSWEVTHLSTESPALPSYFKTFWLFCLI